MLLVSICRICHTVTIHRNCLRPLALRNSEKSRMTVAMQLSASVTHRNAADPGMDHSQLMPYLAAFRQLFLDTPYVGTGSRIGASNDAPFDPVQVRGVSALNCGRMCLARSDIVTTGHASFWTHGTR